jgi:hypothetical protein
MKALGIAAAAAIALAPFSVVATTPGVAQAAPFAGAGADPKGCQQCPFLVAQYRISTEPTLPEPAPTTVTPVQTPQVVPPSPPPPSTIPVVAADEEPTRPWWPSALHYGVLVLVVGLVAWTVGLSLRRAIGTPQIPPRPEPDQKKEVDRQSIRMYKRNLEILNSRYSDFERRVFDQIAETDRRSFIVEAGFEVLLLHAVRDGLLKRVELSPVAIQRGEPTHHKYEVTDAGLNFVSRYIRGEDGVGEHQSGVNLQKYDSRRAQNDASDWKASPV